jgi:hypothetical protein
VARGGLGEAGGEAAGGLLEPAVGGAAVGGELGERRPSGRHRQRVAGERAGLVDRAGRRHLAHQVAAAAEGAGRQAAADHLAEGGQVRPDAEQLLGAAPGHPEAGHHLVEDEERAVAVAQRAQPLEIAGLRRHQAHVAGDRLDEDGGDLAAALGEARLGGGEVVVGRHQGGAVTAAGTPGDEGTPIVAAPEPAATRKGSAWPW